jgi:4'-phosphopantetheinyl transferase
MTVPQFHWPDAPEQVSLTPGEVHVWCASLEPPPGHVERLAETLSADEQARAARFGRPELRDRFIAGRGRLRTILARYLDTTPEQPALQYSARGKPSLAPPWNGKRLFFNMSHSRGVAVYAIVTDGEVGIDIEGLRPVGNMTRLVERYFHHRERHQWLQLPPELQQRGFFCGWTRKEAWLKAIGSGLTFPLDGVCVSLAPGEPARILSIQGDAGAADAWWLDSCEPAAGYVLAVAMRGTPTAIHRWCWPSSGLYRGLP